jgi:hypothetical protein
MSTPDVNACRMCGEVLSCMDSSDVEDDDGLYAVECECGVRGPHCLSPSGAIAQWNMLQDRESVRSCHRPELFFIQDTREYVGNCMLFWRPDGRGYTTDLKRAGRYTRAEYSRRTQRETDVLWPVGYVLKHSVMHFRSDREGISNPLDGDSDA